MNGCHHRKLSTATGVAIVLACLWTFHASAQVSVGTLDHRDYDLDDMGISNPGAITYAAGSGFFYILQATEEASFRIFVVTPHETLVDTFEVGTRAISTSNIAFDNHTSRLLIYDPATQQLLALET